GMVMARYGRASNGTLVYSSIAVGITMFMAAFAPNLWSELLALWLVGLTSCVAAASGSAITQLTAAPSMRGRVMGLYTVGSTGMRPIGGVIVGYVGQHVGPRAALAFGGFSVALALGLWWAIGRTASRAAPVDTRNGARSDPGAVSSPAARA